MVDLDTMTLIDKRKLLDQLIYELKPADKPESGRMTDDECDFWNVLVDVLVMNGQHRQANLRRPEAYARNFGVLRFRECVAAYRCYVLGACQKGNGRAVRNDVMRVVLMCVVKHLTALEITISAESILAQADHVGQLVNKRFPGYAAAGLLDRVARIA